MRDQTVSKHNESAARDMRIDAVSASTATIFQDAVSMKLSSIEYRCRLERPEFFDWAIIQRSLWWISLWQQFIYLFLTRLTIIIKVTGIDGVETLEDQIALTLTISISRTLLLRSRCASCKKGAINGSESKSYYIWTWNWTFLDHGLFQRVAIRSSRWFIVRENGQQKHGKQHWSSFSHKTRNRNNIVESQIPGSLVLGFHAVLIFIWISEAK